MNNNNYVKNFDDFIKESKNMELAFESLDLQNYKTIDESVANEDIDKATLQIGYFQSLVNDELYRLIEKEHKYTNVRDLMSAIEKFAKEKYKEVVTEKDAKSYDVWWKDFSSKENIMRLDRILKWRS